MQRNELKAIAYREHYSQPVRPETGVVEYFNEPHPWAVLIADRGLAFCDSREEAVELANAKGDCFLEGDRTVMRLYSTLTRPDGRKFAKYI